ncbi:MAG TPA: Na+/H+ antiporter subunit E [Afifellaceae bacterium]|nr:Na+/H+ antiporter subunit E [Afifellaceae bacterium]
MRLILIALTLLAYWLLLSGHYTPWLIGAGIVCSAGIVAFGVRMGFADEEGFPAGLLPRAATYWPWLALEIVKSALGVVKLILDPRLPISPKLIRVDATQKTAVGLTTFANSITLTPGTISVEVSEAKRQIWVHAISSDTAAGLDDGEMDRRVTHFETGPA